MPTYQVTCAECHEDRWPVLPERPTRYVCARCTATPAATKAARKIATRKRQESRRRTRQEPA